LLHFLHGDVLLLAPDEAPNLIDLNPLSLDVAHRCVLEGGTGRPDFLQYPKNGTLGNPSQTRRGADGAPFDEGRDHRNFLVHTELVHGSSRTDRSGMSRAKQRKVGLFCRSLFAPPLLSRKASHLASFPWVKEGHTVLSASLSALSAHSGHDLRNETQAHGNGFGLAYGLQNYAARILDSIESFRFGCFTTCAFWHYDTSFARFGESRQEGEISN
jgi:hypothetical protein